MTQNQSIEFDSHTDKLEALTHIVNKILHENGGEVILQQARVQTLEELQDQSGSDELEQFDGEDFDDFVQNSDRFDISTNQFGQETIDNVRTVGPRPEWLNLPDSLIADENQAGAFDPVSDASINEDDFAEIDCLTQHQPDALKEAGYSTYRDLYETDEDELADVDGITGAEAAQIRNEASQLIDPVDEIFRECYQAEQNGDVDPDDPVSEGIAEAHEVSNVEIPACEPRNPAEFDGRNPPAQIVTDRFKLPLPVLQRPTFKPGIVQDIVNDVESVEEFKRIVKGLTKYDVQYDEFELALDNLDINVDGLVDAFSSPRDDEIVENLFMQVGVTRAQLADAIETFDDSNLTEHGAHDLSNMIDLQLEDAAPVKSRLRVADALEQKLETHGSLEELTANEELDDLVEASEAPIEIDHPFIEEVEDFPPIRTRTLETGEEDIEAVARIMAKNNYPIDLVGHAGIGKDTVIRYLGALTNRPTVVINMDESMISQELMGKHNFNEQGILEFEDGIIPHCAKYGFILCISETNAAAPEILTYLHQALERNGKIHVKEHDEIIIPSNKFRIASTRNPPTAEYDGAKRLNGAFKRRLNSLWLEYLEPEEEAALINDMVNGDRTIISQDNIKQIVDIVNKFRNEVESGNRTIPRPTTSEITQIIDIYDGTDDLMGAIKVGVRGIMDPEMHDAEACMNMIEDEF